MTMVMFMSMLEEQRFMFQISDTILALNIVHPLATAILPITVNTAVAAISTALVPVGQDAL
jgi:hypothetical protein